MGVKMKIEVKGITKQFKSVKALNHIYFTIADGNMISLLGPSGCGKTTLLMILAGLIEPSQGDVLFDDKMVNGLPPERRDIGMVFQDYALYPHMTVEENILFPLKMKKMDRKSQRNALKDIAGIVEINELLKRKPSELSGGQMQRVAIARALIKKPQLLLLDEPLSNLDARLRVQLREEIRKIQKEIGVTTVFVTHDQEEAMSISDQIILMKNGEIIQSGSPKELFCKPKTVFAARFLGNPPAQIYKGPEKVSLEEWYPEKMGPIHENIFQIGIRPESIYRAENGIDFKVIDIQIMGREQRVTFKRGDVTLVGVFAIENQFELGLNYPLKISKVMCFNEMGEIINED